MRKSVNKIILAIITALGFSISSTANPQQAKKVKRSTYFPRKEIRIMSEDSVPPLPPGFPSVVSLYGVPNTIFRDIPDQTDSNDSTTTGNDTIQSSDKNKEVPNEEK